MRMPDFMPLARLDNQHFITACRHGVVHLIWGRITTRFSRDEFRRLAAMLEQAADALPPASVRDGELRVTARLDEDCELQMGPLILLLPAGQFQELAKAAQEAVQRLDEILASGAWDEEGPEEVPPNPLERLRRIPFSRN
jgi:hypothetical protein